MSSQIQGVRPGSIPPKANFNPGRSTSTTNIERILERRISDASTGSTAPCRVVALSPITASGVQTVDTVVVNHLDRVCRAGETDQTLNGLFIVNTGGLWERTVDSLDPTTTGAILITGGSAQNAGSLFRCTNAAAPAFGTDTIAFARVYADVYDGWISNAKLRPSAGLSVVGRSGNTTGAVADIVGTDGQVLRVLGATLGFGLLVAANITDATITSTKLTATGVTAASYTSANITVDVQGRITNASNGSSGISSVTAGAGLTGGTITVSGTIAVDYDNTTLGINGSSSKLEVKDAGISNAKFRSSSGLSVVGRSGNSSGAVADITGTDGQVLRVSGTTLGFGLLVAANVTDATLTSAKLTTTGVTAGSYTYAGFTVDAQGRITTASSGFPGVNPATFLILAGIQNNGYLQLKTRPSAETNNFTVTSADCIIEVDTTAAAPVGGKFIGTLPAANTVNSAANPLRWILYVSDVGASASTKNIRLQTQGSDTINGNVTTFVDLASNGGAFLVTSNGVSKFTIQKLTGA